MADETLPLDALERITLLQVREVALSRSQVAPRARAGSRAHRVGLPVPRRLALERTVKVALLLLLAACESAPRPGTRYCSADHTESWTTLQPAYAYGPQTNFTRQVGVQPVTSFRTVCDAYATYTTADSIRWEAGRH